VSGFAQEVGKAIEMGFPVLAVARDPRAGVSERLRGQSALPHATVASHRRQPGALQHAQMFRDRGQGHGERLSQVTDRAFPGRESRQDGATCGIGECGEGSIE
jgi:hypothetical protein